MTFIKWKLLASAAVLAGALGLAGPAFAVDDPGKFELDGNAAEEGAVGPDWQSINLGVTPDADCEFITATGVIEDPEGTSIFTSSKDIQQISPPQVKGGPNNVWGHTSGSAPDKDEITNAYAAAYDCPEGLTIYFGADRFANDGDALLAFWFFQESVQALPGGDFSGRHVVGDILVLANFVDGGTTAEVGVFAWAEGDNTADIKDGNVPVIKTIIAPGAATCDQSGGKDVCAVTNTVATPLFWSYTPKGGSLNDPAPDQSFFEGGIIIDQVFTGASEFCISSFMAETRSSSSVTATLKDFALDDFNVCGVEASAVCAIKGDGFNDDFTAFTYEISGDVNSTRGSLASVDILRDVTLDGVSNDDVIIDTKANVTTTPVAWGPVDFTTPNNGEDYQIYALTTVGDLDIPSEVQLADCPLVDASPALSITKVCRTCLAVENSMVKVNVHAAGMVCNEDDIPLINVAINDDQGTADPSDDMTIDIGSLGTDTGVDDCASYSLSYAPETVNSPDPSMAMFQDKVTATAETALGFLVEPEEATAMCKLCPPGGTDPSGISCPPL